MNGNTLRGLLVCALALPFAAVSLAEEPTEKALAKRVTISHKKITLENAILELAEISGLRIELLRKDLQLEGITKNQTITIDMRDKPVSEVLQVILLKANPDGKLAYVVKQSGVLVITTRAAAAKREEVALPPLA